MKEFGKIMLIIGSVIGSGFASGKEIAVFFSRFGVLSYFFIPVSFLLFFGVFYWIMNYGEKGIKKLNSSKFFLVVSIVVCLVFTSSMFAGTLATIKTGVLPLDILLTVCLIFICLLVIKHGINFLAKSNEYLIPIAIVVLLCCLIKNLNGASSFFINAPFSAFLFSILYVIMNVSTSCFVMAELGKDLTKRSKLIVAFSAALILAMLLIFINFVLLGNEGSLSLSMPLLEMSSGPVSIMMKIVIFLGCLTSLMSLVFSVSRYLKKLGCSNLVCDLISVILPFFTSFLGFSNIVTILYPVVSVLGIFLIYPFIPTPKIFKRKNLKKAKPSEQQKE